MVATCMMYKSWLSSLCTVLRLAILHPLPNPVCLLISKGIYKGGGGLPLKINYGYNVMHVLHNKFNVSSATVVMKIASNP